MNKILILTIVILTSFITGCASNSPQQPVVEESSQTEGYTFDHKFFSLVMPAEYKINKPYGSILRPKEGESEDLPPIIFGIINRNSSLGEKWLSIEEEKNLKESCDKSEFCKKETSYEKLVINGYDSIKYSSIIYDAYGEQLKIFTYSIRNMENIYRFWISMPFEESSEEYRRKVFDEIMATITLK